MELTPVYFTDASGNYYIDADSNYFIAKLLGAFSTYYKPYAYHNNTYVKYKACIKKSDGTFVKVVPYVVLS